jgi:ribosomal protein S18 acetylase RimI-like enzyme
MIEIVRVVTVSQIESVSALAAEIWREHYTPIIGAAQVDYMLEKFQSVEAVKNQIDRNELIYYLLYTDQQPAGYFAVQIKSDEVFLSKLYVASHKRKLGLAKNAIDFIKIIAENNCLKRISLTINKNNNEALAAYERLGFKNEKAIVTDIGNGFYMDDFVLILDVN